MLFLIPHRPKLICLCFKVLHWPLVKLVPERVAPLARYVFYVLYIAEGMCRKAYVGRDTIHITWTVDMC